MNTHLNVPSSLSEPMKSELIGDLCGVHRVGQILFVGENKEESITELILVQHPLELFTGLRHTLTIVGVNNENDALGVLEVCRKAGLTKRTKRGKSAAYNASTKDESYPDLRHPTQ